MQSRHQPLHVTVRVRAGLPSLRSQSIFLCLRQQIATASRRFLRIVHFSVQSNHIHLIVEANDRSCLARGMKGFGVRVARHLNGLLSSRGQVWGDRYHAHALKTPREVRNALVYVFFNHKKHQGGAAVLLVDPCSSASVFDGWAPGLRPLPKEVEPGPGVTEARTWLLRRGWKRLGALDSNDSPALALRPAR